MEWLIVICMKKCCKKTWPQENDNTFHL